MSESKEGSGARLLQLCIGYFAFYTISNVALKYFIDPSLAHHASSTMKDLEFLVYQSIGGSGVCLAVIFARGWFRLQSNGPIKWGPLSFPREYVYIIPSGICTAVVIPTTTLMYTLPINVMVAMVIMRGAVIVISRLVDAVQIWQGILKKRVYWQENAAVVFAIGAVCAKLFFGKKDGQFDFVNSKPAMTILEAYIVAYLLRIYIMNYFKNTRAKGVKQDNNGFFGVEQISATVTMIAAGFLVFHSPRLFGWHVDQIEVFRGAITHVKPLWKEAAFSGCFYGAVAFFSVFIFIFRGTTATFAGLVNRLTSLIAGTAATLITWKALGGKAPTPEDWYSLGLILVAVAFLTIAERRRSAESATIPGLGGTAGTGVWTGPQKP